MKSSREPQQAFRSNAIATVADVVNAVMFFLSDESAFLTGVALDVDGGLLSTMPVPGY